jgi:hypothetical protein
MKKIIFVFFVMVFIVPVLSFAQGLENYIIQNDIGVYKFRPKPTKEIYGNSGVVVSADHFDEDHDDISYITRYIKPEPILGVDVQVTQHTGGDSDRWLLHELDAEFRTYYGIPGDEYAVVPINGNTILECGSAGWDYRWISGNKVIKISYNDAQMTKPEPLEVVKAYLAKHPSTIAPFTLQELRNSANVIKWIKDEMDRRLWLCDKWNAQFQAGQTTQKDLLYNLNRSIGVFLNYRQKYFGVSATDDLNAMSVYMQNNDLASIQKKLTEYKTWWNKHKGKSIRI